MRYPGLVNNEPHLVKVSAYEVLGRRLSLTTPQTFMGLVVQGNQITNQLIQTATPPRGLTLSNAPGDTTNDIAIASGQASLTIGDPGVAILASSLTKQLDATWVQGAGLGGRFSGVSLTNTTYHVFLLYDPATGIVDAGFDTSLVAANRPSGWSARRIGSIVRKSNTIVQFVQSGWYFELKPYQVDLDGVFISTAGSLYPITVPTGVTIRVTGVFATGTGEFNDSLAFSIQSSTQNALIPVSNPNQTAFRGMAGTWSYNAPATSASSHTIFLVVPVTAAQIWMRRTGSYYASSSGVASTWQTLGWFDDLLLTGG